MHRKLLSVRIKREREREGGERERERLNKIAFLRWSFENFAKIHPDFRFVRPLFYLYKPHLHRNQEKSVWIFQVL